MKTNRNNAFTLIEAIISLTIVAILLAALVISFIKRLDRIAGLKEVAALKSIATAFKESVKRSRYVPDHTGWASAVAGQLGWQTNDVTANDRNFPRIFLFDPTMQIGTNNATPLIPYAQTISGSMVNSGGSIVRPINPRFMVLSSIGTPLPSSLASGLGDVSGANAFTNIWFTPDRGVPTGWSGMNGADLKIERIDLSDLFVQIVLANADTTLVPSYGVDNLTAVNVPYTSSPPPPMYFIRGSELKLYDENGTLEYSEILHGSRDYTFELGSWQGKPYLGRAVDNPMGKDLQRAMDLFLRAPVNQNAQGGATKQSVYNAMVAYMEAFIAWRDNGYPGESCPGPVANNSYSDAVAAARATLSNVTDDLINP